MKAWGAIALLLLFASTYAASAEELQTLVNQAAGTPEMRQLLGSKALVQIRVGSQNDFYSWNGAEFSRASGGEPDFTITTTDNAMRSLSNAEDKASHLKCLLSKNAITIYAIDASKHAAIQAAIRAQASCPARTWYTSPRHEFYSNDARNFGIYFARPPGYLARSPGLIYDTVSRSPNAVGPWNIFKINPGLIGPNDILRLNPGLIGPADIALLNPNLHGPAQFAYMMGIGAHSNTARHLMNTRTIDLGPLDSRNRWGNRR
ncbi:MAG: hypothetical protein QXR53_03680 [Candidatus Norongarragalinales archaeon]